MALTLRVNKQLVRIHWLKPAPFIVVYLYSDSFSNECTPQDSLLRSHSYLWHNRIQNQLVAYLNFPIISAFILVVTTLSVCNLPILEHAKVIRCPSSCSMVVFNSGQCSSLFGFLSFPTTPDKSRALCIVFGPRFRWLICSNLSLCPLRRLSISGFHYQSFKLWKRSQSSFQHFACSDIPWREPATFFLPGFIPYQWSLGCWDCDSLMNHFRYRGKQLHGFTGSHCLRLWAASFLLLRPTSPTWVSHPNFVIRYRSSQPVTHSFLCISVTND